MGKPHGGFFRRTITPSEGFHEVRIPLGAILNLRIAGRRATRFAYPLGVGVSPSHRERRMILKITFRLRPGKDEDLIKWVKSFNDGERSHFIRQALKKVVTRKPVRLG